MKKAPRIATTGRRAEPEDRSEAVLRKLSWIITIPITVVCVVFALANRQSVMVDLWPFAISYEPPLFLLVLGALLVGFLLGVLVTWFAAGRTRDKARRAHYRASDLEREVAWLRRKQGQSPSQSPEGGQLPAAIEPPRASTG